MVAAVWPRVAKRIADYRVEEAPLAIKLVSFLFDVGIPLVSSFNFCCSR